MDGRLPMILYTFYQELFLGQFIQDAVAEYDIKLLIVNVTRQEIALWKE